MLKVFPVINYSLFYGTAGVPENPLEKIAGYDTENVILFLISIRNCFRIQGRKYSEFKLFQTFLKNLPTYKAARLLTLLEDGEVQYHLVTTVVVNKLLIGLFNQLPNTNGGISLDVPEFSEDVLDSILICNEIHYASKNILIEPDTPELLWKIMLMQDVNATDEVNFTRTSTPKHLIFLRFLRTFFKDGLGRLNDHLRDNHGVSNIHEFFLTIINMYVQLTNVLKNGNTLIKVAPAEAAHYLLHGLKLVIEKEAINSGKFDIGVLITKPFFKHRDGNLYLIDHRDFAFLTEKAWMYSLFSIGGIGAVKPELSRLNDYLSFIGKEYYEKYLLSNLLSSLESSGIRVLKSDDQHLPDMSIIVNEKDVFLFEIKSTSLNYRSIDEQKVQDFKDFIDKQFASEKKGVSQLIRNINYLANDIHDLFGLRNPSGKLSVIPVIIYVEYHLDTPAVNAYVNEQFQVAIEQIDNPFKQVTPLTMIHYDFFIENISLLKKDRGLLKRLITDYWRNAKKKSSKYHKYRSTLNYMESKVSFDRYVLDKEGIYRVSKEKVLADMAEIFHLREEI